MDEPDYFERRVGTTLRGKWTLERLLGVGGMAAVYESVHTKLGRRDAVKILHPAIAHSADARQRFEQEAFAVNRLQHPGAIEVRDIEVTEDGAPFLVMELLEGESLADRLRARGPLPAEDVFRYAEQILDVLAAAHAAGIIHRDIKPDNLFLLRDGRVKVLDFGVARLRQRNAPGTPTRTGALIGTVAYMAPEQVSGRSDLDGRADIFSVGATMFRLITGQHLYPTDNELQLIMQMATEPAPSVRSVCPGLPEGMARVIDRALAFDREQRYPDAASMRADVLRVLGGEQPASALAPALPPQDAPGVNPTVLPGDPRSVAAPALSASAFPVPLAVQPTSPPPVTQAPAVQGTPPTLVTSLSALSHQPTSLGGTSLAPWQQGNPVTAHTTYPAPAALVPAPPGVSGTLERIGRKTVHLPFPVVVALAVVVALLVGSAGCVVLWKTFSKDRAPPPAPAPTLPHPHPTEHPTATATTPAPVDRPIATAPPPTDRPAPTGGILPGGNIPAIPTHVVPTPAANGKGKKDKGKKDKK
jgi:serine/threonine-protein kinase